jgi:hypothetical protein
MFLFMRADRVAAAMLCAAAVSACSTAEPVAYRDIASSTYLAPNRQDDADRVPYTYATAVDWRSYNFMIIDPVGIYQGADNQFGDMSEEDKVTLADYMLDSFTKTLSSRFARATQPATNTLRLKLTLTGAETSMPVLSTLTRFDIAGGIYNGVQAVSGGEGMLTGSVLYAVEIYDAATNQLLAASVNKQYPNAFNLAAGFGSLSAAETGIDKGAEALLEQLSR